MIMVLLPNVKKLKIVKIKEKDSGSISVPNVILVSLGWQDGITIVNLMILITIDAFQIKMIQTVWFIHKLKKTVQIVFYVKMDIL